MLFKVLLVFFLISLALRFVLPVLIRYLVVGFLQKQARRHAQQFNAGPFSAAPEPPRNGAPSPGQVRVDYVPPTPRAASKPEEFQGGEYVEFEEVK